MRLTPFWGRAALLAAALIWGSSFIVMKSAVTGIPVFMLLGIRFTAGCGLLCLLMGKKLRRIGKKQVLHGAVVGVLLFLAYVTQTYGLKATTPGKNAFLTAVYCVLVPFIGWLMFRRRPTAWNWLAAILCLAGVGFVSLEGDFTMNHGDALTLLGGVFFALHMIAVGRFGAREDPVALTMLQFGAGAVLCWVCSLALETPPAALPSGALAELIYLAVFPTAAAMLLQNLGQSVTPPAQSAILLSLESVFGAAFSVALGAESLTLRLLLGFLLIFLAVVGSETQFAFLRRKI